MILMADTRFKMLNDKLDANLASMLALQAHLDAGKHVSYECSLFDASFLILKEVLLERENTKDFQLYRLNLLTIRTRFDFIEALAKTVALENKSGTLEDLFKTMQEHAKKARQTFVIWIDEAHMMEDFEDVKTFLAELKTLLMESTSVLFCFAGSRIQTMQKLFTKRNAPLADTVATIRFEKTDIEAYIPIIIEAFAHVGKKITPEVAQKIVNIADGRAEVIQRLLWILDLRAKKNISTKKVYRATQELVAVLNPSYRLQTAKLTTKQINFLRAMTAGLNRGFATQENLSLFRLGNSANVARLKDSLLEKNIIYVTHAGLVQFTDPLYGFWLREHFEAQN